MTIDFSAAMRRAAHLTQNFKLENATRVIQQALGRQARASEETQAPQVLQAPRLRRPLGDVVNTLAALRRDAPSPLRREAPAPVDPRFSTRHFSCAAGARKFKLYVPASLQGGQPAGLIVMLHGCQQTPDDFAAGTRMNSLGEAHRLIIAWPEQPRSANASSCWNWFNPADQSRDAGEPAVIAGLTRSLMQEFSISHENVFVAGLSAGGAMAVVMGATWPDIYAGVGVHSGLAYRSASDVMSALGAMRGGGALPALPSDAGCVRTIIFHGTADKTVHPRNASDIVRAAGGAAGAAESRTSHAAGGRTAQRTVYKSNDGPAPLEVWMIEGAGHAWSGGSTAGSYADPAGPDASAQMVRFFLGTAEG